MKKTLTSFLLLLLAVPAGFAASDEKEEERLKESGVVLKEILDIPDDIPQDLLDKAECVVVLPSVKKGAFGVGASYGRGVWCAAAVSILPTSGERRHSMRWKV